MSEEYREIPSNVVEAISNLKGEHAQTFFQWVANEIGVGDDQEEDSAFFRGRKAHHVFMARLLEIELKVK